MAVLKERKYRIVPNSNNGYTVQYKTGWFWWTAMIYAYECGWPETFETKEAAREWIRKDIRRIKHANGPIVGYP